MRPHRSLVLASLPSQCVVCRGHQQVRRADIGGVIPCPHCMDQLPVIYLPIRIDHPKDGAA